MRRCSVFLAVLLAAVILPWRPLEMVRSGSLTVAAETAGAQQFQPWSENVFHYVRQEYGEPAEKRLRYLHNLVAANQGLPVTEKLQLVNRTMNHLPWIADQEHWNSVDYWATPLETIATFGGDCEDIAIAKWVVLNHLGIDNDHLRLAYSKIRRTGESHMVLLHIDRPEVPLMEQTVLVLDNYVDEIKKGAERKDLLAVYLTDVHGNLILLADNAGERKVQGVYKERKMKKLQDLKAKITANREKFRQLNDGRPLLPPAP